MQKYLVLTLVDTGFHPMSPDGRLLLRKTGITSLMPIKLTGGEIGSRVNDRFDVWESEEEILDLISPFPRRAVIDEEVKAQEVNRLMFQEEAVIKKKGKKK